MKSLAYIFPIIVPVAAYMGGCLLGRYHQRLEQRKFNSLGQYAQNRCGFCGPPVATELTMNKTEAPSPMQVANDLRAQAKALEGRHLSGTMMNGVCRSLIRGAHTIEHLLKVKCDLEAAAQAEAQKYEDYVYGNRS